MTVWIALVAGILIGWIIEWIIDWFYWRRNLADFYATETQLRRQLATTEEQLAELRAVNDTLRADLNSARSEQTPVPAEAMVSGDDEPDNPESDGMEIEVADADSKMVDDESNGVEIDTVEADSEAAEEKPDNTESDGAGTEIADVAAEPDMVEAAIATPVAPLTPTARLDDLTKINGIGPVYRRKLHEAGIYTFGQLATASPDQLDTAVAPEGFQKPAFEQWIADAGKLVIPAADAEDDRADAPNTPVADEEG